MKGDRTLTEQLLYIIPDLETFNRFCTTLKQYEDGWSEGGYYLDSLLDNKGGSLALLIEYLKAEYHAGHDIDPQIQELRNLLESASSVADIIRPDASLPAELRSNIIMLGYKCSNWIKWIDEYFPHEQSKQEPGQEETSIKQDSGFRSCLHVQDDKQEELLKKLHSLIDGKKGKGVALVIGSCVELGLMTKPTFGVLKAEFGDIGNKSGFDTYYREFSTKYTDKEMAGIKSQLEPFLKLI